MRYILILLLSIQLFADLKEEMLIQYKNSEFESVCTQGSQNFSKYRKDEEFISLYAFACLYSDHINKLSIPMIVLKNSSESRANSAYLSIVLMQEKLLKHALIDDYELTAFTLPSTDYILSKVFDMYAKMGKHAKQDFYVFQDSKDKNLSYKLYLEKTSKGLSIAIDEISNNQTIKHHIFY